MRLNPEIFATFLADRSSIRRFSDQPISDRVIERALACACRAPSAHNRQPWRFIVLSDPADKSRLAESMGEKLRVDHLADGRDPNDVEAAVLRSYDRITGAMVVVVLCLSMEDVDRYQDERRAQAAYLMAAQSVAMAGQNLLLAVHAEGLGACWMCAPLFAQDVVSKTLELPEAWKPQGMILIGHAADGGSKRGRKSVTEVTRWR